MWGASRNFIEIEKFIYRYKPQSLALSFFLVEETLWVNLAKIAQYPTQWSQIHRWTRSHYTVKLFIFVKIWSIFAIKWNFPYSLINPLSLGCLCLDWRESAAGFRVADHLTQVIINLFSFFILEQILYYRQEKQNLYSIWGSSGKYKNM